MGVTITVKPKTKGVAGSKAKAVVEAPVSNLKVQVDELVALSKQVEDFKPVNKKYLALRKELLDKAEAEYTAAETILMSGTIGQVQWGPKSDERTITDLRKVHKILGDAAFYALAKIGITDLCKYLTPEQQAMVIKSDPTGSRAYSFMPLPQGEDE
jgi:hypothetical protein